MSTNGLDDESGFRLAIIGRVPIEVRVMQHWYGGELDSPVNVVFLRLGESSWLRLFFDAPHFFWREVVRPDAIEPVGQSEFRMIGLPAPSSQLGSVDDVFFGGEGNVRSLRIRYTSGTSLVLENVEDRSTLAWVHS
jgi:hypothetical protein